MNNLSSLFQSQNEIPSEYRLDAPFHQREYLANGEIRIWEGETTEVVSPIFIKNEDGTFTQPVIGSYPQLTAEATMEALDSAAAAYDYGRGEWPTMTVENRIKCIENFVQKNANV